MVGPYWGKRAQIFPLRQITISLRYLFHFILWLIVFNDRLRLVFERFQSFGDRFFVVIDAFTRFCSCQQPSFHCFGRTFKVQHKLTVCDLIGETKIVLVSMKLFCCVGGLVKSLAIYKLEADYRNIKRHSPFQGLAFHYSTTHNPPRCSDKG